MWWGADGWGWVGWFSMALVMVTFWVLVILLVVWLVRGTGPLPRVEGGSGRSTAHAILEERFARGEIDREEFERRRATLLGR